MPAAAGDRDLPEIATLDELCGLVATQPDLYVRFSHGPAADSTRPSRDYESGLEMPGLSVNPLTPEAWWTRDPKEWVARELCAYAHLGDEPDGRYAWVLTGHVVGRGPDNEPLVLLKEPVGALAEHVLDEAKALYAERFDVGRDSRG